MTALVDARGVTVILGGSRVLDGVDVRLHRGDQVALVGRSGSGKSTLLLALAGLLQVDAGEVRWPALEQDPAGRRAQLAMVFQAPSLVAELTAEQNVVLPLRLRGQPRAAAYAAAGKALADLGLQDAAGALPEELSGGQQQRVAVARVLAGRPLVVFADEPTGTLDADTAAQVVRVLRAHVFEVGGALLLATHDVELAAGLAAQWEVRDGALFETALPAVPPVDVRRNMRTTT